MMQLTCAKSRQRRTNRTGAMLVLIAVCLPVLLILVAFAIQTSYHQLSRTELRTVVDASAEAAARVLSSTGNQAQAIQAAKDAAGRNLVAGDACTLDDVAIEFGVVLRGGANTRFNFTPTNFNPTAVRVTATEQRPYVFPYLANSFAVNAKAVAGQTDRDIALVLDRSGSMAAVNDDGSPSGWTPGLAVPTGCRWDKMVQAANQFLDELELTPAVEQVSLVTYNEASAVDRSLISNYQTIRDAIDAHTAAFQGGATNIASGIEQARLTLQGSGSRGWAAKTIVVMTDGMHNSGTVAPEDAAAAAVGQGITIHTLTYGYDADVGLMEAVAQTGGGSHWHAPNSGMLSIAFREIANTVPTMLME